MRRGCRKMTEVSNENVDLKCDRAMDEWHRMLKAYVERMPWRMLWYAGYPCRLRLVQAMKKAVDKASYPYLLSGHRSIREQRDHDLEPKTVTRRMNSNRVHGRDSSRQIQAEAISVTKQSRPAGRVQGCRPDMFVGMRFERLEHRWRLC
jgi:hypothetical protein